MSVAAVVPRRRAPARTAAAFAGLAAALAAAAVLDLVLGPAGVGPAEALRLLFAPDGSADAGIVQAVRLPRIVAGAAAGAALGVAGVLLQVALRNGIADPSTVGINAGAYLAVTAAAVSGLALGPLSTVPFALAGALLAAGAVLALSRAGDPLRLVLAGIAVTLACQSGAQVLLSLNQESTGGLLLWGAGSIEQPGWEPVRLLAPLVPAVLAAVVVLARDLDALALGDDAAEGLGVPAARTRLLAIGGAALLAALAVSLAGPIAFVGLAAPHLCRRLGVRAHRPLALAAAGGGGALLLGADAAALAFGGEQLATGVVCTVLGAPLLIAVARTVPVQAAASSLRGGGGRRRGRRSLAAHPRAGAAVLAAAALAAFIGAIGVGELVLGPADVVRGLLGQGEWAVVVQELRLPRALVAAAAGAALGVSGVVLQGVARNPLAAPEMLGVTGGASVGAVVLLLAVGGSATAVAVAAFAGGLLALGLVVALAPRDLDPARFTLIGVAMAAACSGLVSAMLVRGGEDAILGVLFLSGSTYGAGWDELAVVAPLAAAGVAAGWLAARRLDALGGGDDLATALGVRPSRARAGLVTLAAVLAAGAVATVGAVGFVGLAAPHLARLLVGPAHRRAVPAAAITGALLLLLADLVGRSVLTEAREVPSGLVTALLGAPLLLALLRRRQDA